MDRDLLEFLGVLNVTLVLTALLTAGIVWLVNIPGLPSWGALITPLFVAMLCTSAAEAIMKRWSSEGLGGALGIVIVMGLAGPAAVVVVVVVRNIMGTSGSLVPSVACALCVLAFWAFGIVPKNRLF